MTYEKPINHSEICENCGRAESYHAYPDNQCPADDDENWREGSYFKPKNKP